ncbi:MAG: tungsten formylmethanofuran dehydrogenase [Parvibaculaceae bacterium]
MAAAFIDGQSVALREAIREAARLLEQARNPIVAGMGTDTAGARAAIRLAEHLRCPFDHLASDAALASLEVMRDSGWMIVSPQEARRLADVVLLVGAFSKARGNEILERLPRPPSHVVLVGGAASARQLEAAGYKVELLAANDATLPALLSALKARTAGRPVAGNLNQKLDRLVDVLRGARFGVAIWSADGLDRLCIEMLSGLVKDLNAETRFSGFALPVPGNGSGVAQTAGWLTGFPMRTSFGRDGSTHDPWRFDADRLVAEDEADTALWISAYEPVPPPWPKPVPLIALTAVGTRFPNEPKVRFDVGTPGVDHDAVQWNGKTGALAAIAATASSERPRTDEIIEAIRAAMAGSPA